MNPIELNVNWKTKTIVILRSKGNIPLDIDASGNAEITEEMFKAMNTKAIDRYESEIAELLESEDQIAILYSSWGSASSIIIGNTASVVDIDKRLAKQIIILGERYGILYQASSYVWKIKDDAIQSRWLNKAKGITEGPKKEEPTNEELIKRTQERHAAFFKEKEREKKKGHDSDSDSDSNSNNDNSNESESKSEVKVKEESPVEVIPEEPLKNTAKDMLQHKIKKLNEAINDPNLIENEIDNKHIMISERNKLQVELRNIEIQQFSKHSGLQGVPITASGSMTNITSQRQRKLEPDVTKRNVTKGKPSPRKPVPKKT